MVPANIVSKGTTETLSLQCIYNYIMEHPSSRSSLKSHSKLVEMFVKVYGEQVVNDGEVLLVTRIGWFFFVYILHCHYGDMNWETDLERGEWVGEVGKVGASSELIMFDRRLQLTPHYLSSLVL